MNEAKEVERCEVHYWHMGDGRCCCPHECADCGTTYRGPNHSKDDCITVLKSRLKLDDLAARIEALSANVKSASHEELVAAAKADLLANISAGKQTAPVCENCHEIREGHHNWQSQCNKPYPGYGVSFWLASVIGKQAVDECEGGESCWYNSGYLPEEFEPELPPTQRLHTYIAKQHEKMRQAAERLQACVGVACYPSEYFHAIKSALDLLFPEGNKPWL